MKAARLIVLGVAVAAGLGAAYLMMGTKPTEVVRVVPAPPPPPPPQEAVLVASRDLNPGSVVALTDLKWQNWANAVPPGVLQKSQRPNANVEMTGLVVRAPILAGTPVRPDRLRDTSSLLSAALPAGTRAVAIDLADQGRSSAGGFIKPDEHVDVIRTFHPDDAPSAFASETILTNVRVLAIGQTEQEKAGERTVFGGTATLELTSEQAEKVVLAQRTGQLTLSLRSMSDAANGDRQPSEEPSTMTVIRSGNASQSRVR